MAETQAAWESGRFRPGKGRRDSEILFGQVREDAGVEIAATASIPAPDLSVFCIGSAGCTALSLLAVDPRIRRMTVLDINPAQAHLVRLKAAIRQQSDLSALRQAVLIDGRPGYAEVRGSLAADTRDFWDRRQAVLAHGANHAGQVDRHLTSALRLFYRVILSVERVEGVLNAATLAEQNALFTRDWDTWRWRFALRVLLSRPLLRIVYGAPFVRQVPDRFAEQALADVRAVIVGSPARTNRYLWQAFLSRYPSNAEEALPPYLQAVNQKMLQAALGRMIVEVGDAAAFLAVQKAGTFSFLALSNILDSIGADYAQELFCAAAAVATEGAALCLRSFFPQQPALVATAAAAGWHLDEEASDRLMAINRSPFCRTVLLFRRKMRA